MAWLAVCENGEEVVFKEKPHRSTYTNDWVPEILDNVLGMDLETHYVVLPKGSIKKLIDKELTWEDEPINFK